MITEFRHWVPEGDLKGILVLVPPSQADGRSTIDEKDWREFATEQGLALVGCFFRDDFPTGIEKYCDMRTYRAGETLLVYLQEHFGYDNEVPPIFVWGFSAGGQFAYEWACNYPDYCAGFVLNKGGIYYTALASDKARRVPGLMIIGGRDAEWRKAIVRGLYAVNTIAAGANWILHEESNEGHSIGQSEVRGRELFKQILKGERQ